MLAPKVSVSPLPSQDIQRLLQGIFEGDGAPTDLAIEAFAVTAASLYGWCDPRDIDLALSMITHVSSVPAPRCVHGEHWKTCSQCKAHAAVA